MVSIARHSVGPMWGFGRHQLSGHKYAWGSSSCIRPISKQTNKYFLPFGIKKKINLVATVTTWWLSYRQRKKADVAGRLEVTSVGSFRLHPMVPREMVWEAKVMRHRIEKGASHVRPSKKMK